eukprot:gene9286-10944_t
MTERSFCLEHHGWGASMAHWYARSADVFNRGAGGYNSRWLNAYLPRLLADDKPDLVVLFIGNNDAIDEHEPQHVPLNEYKANVIRILEQLYHAKPSMAVLLVTTTRVNGELKPLQKNSRRRQYAEVLRFIHRNRMRPEVLGTENIPQDMGLVDLWGGEGVNDAPLAQQLEKYSILESDLHDGSHLNSTGNKKVFSALKDTINSLFPLLSPDTIKIRPVRAKRSSSGEYSGDQFEFVNGHHPSSSGCNANKKQMLVAGTGSDKMPTSYIRTTSGSSSSGNVKDVSSENLASSVTNSATEIVPSPHNSSTTQTIPSNVNKNFMIAKDSNCTASNGNQEKGLLIPSLPNPAVNSTGEPVLQWTVPRWRSLV